MIPRISIEDIQRFTADHYHINPSDMVSQRKTRRLAHPRQVAMYLSRKMTSRSLPEIGRRFGGRDHTTVLHACRQVEARMAEDQEFAKTVAALKIRIGVIRPEGFNLLSLGQWMAAARAVRVPHVYARFIAEIAVDDLACFQMEDMARTARLAEFFGTINKAHKPGYVMRWDHCASSDLKAAMARGNVTQPPGFRLTIDDPRAYDLLDDLPPTQTMMTVWQRPWVAARMVNGYPVEYRLFVQNGQIAGVSSYYPQRPLPPTDLVAYEIRLACIYAAAILTAIPLPIANPQVAAAGLDPNQINCTLDFIATERGMLFLEGGPPTTERWGAHTCCFGDRPPVGVVLANGGPIHALELPPKPVYAPEAAA